MEASFSAAVGREEDWAAADLALSLDQDLSLRDALLRRGHVWVGPAGERVAVGAVGDDYVACGPRLQVLAPLARASFDEADGPPPRARSGLLLEILREWVRAGAEVVVATGAVRARGSLLRARRDHLVVLDSGRRRVIPLARVDSVTLFRGGPEGGP